MLANLGVCVCVCVWRERERERERANLGSWILLWIFVIFYFSLSRLGSVGKERANIGS